MAVYTRLEEPFLREMLAIYDVGELSSYEGIAAGSINTMYRLRTTKGTYYLRVNEGKSFDDVIYEKDLLSRLQAGAGALGGVATPRMAKNAANGFFFPVASGKQACIFEELQGRELGVFEVEPPHAAQIGAFLARAHLLLRRFRGRRRNPYRQDVVEAWIRALRRDPEASDVGPMLGAALARVRRHRRRSLPRGVIHGDLFVDNAKWKGGALQAVFDWEMAGRDHLALDVAVALNAWGWRRDATGAGAFVPSLCAALVEGYQRVRPLTDVERRGLFGEACFAALRFTTSRIRDFHLPPRGRVPAGDRLFLDYRDFQARLDRLFDMGPRGLASLVGWSAKRIDIG